MKIITYNLPILDSISSSELALVLYEFRACPVARDDKPEENLLFDLVLSIWKAGRTHSVAKCLAESCDAFAAVSFSQGLFMAYTYGGHLQRYADAVVAGQPPGTRTDGNFRECVVDEVRSAGFVFLSAFSSYCKDPGEDPKQMQLFD